MTISEKSIDACQAAARRELAKTLTAFDHQCGQTLHLDGNIILEVMVYRTLLPILTAVASAAVLRQIFPPERKETSLKDLSTALKALIGRPVIQPDEHQKAKIVESVKAQLSDFSDADTTATVIVESVLKALNEKQASEQRTKPSGSCLSDS